MEQFELPLSYRWLEKQNHVSLGSRISILLLGIAAEALVPQTSIICIQQWTSKISLLKMDLKYKQPTSS